MKRSVPPNCKICRKHDNEAGKVWEGFTRRNAYYFKSFLICRAFGVLPRTGGVDNQNPYQMELFVVLSEMFEKHGIMDAKNFQLKLMGNVKGLF